ncbi:carbamoyltransferase HypF [Haloactinomyces albus]|uniref:Carbamoyltransferase n=1 Tax=Haloactinomyces albus TaxID=1352928 RepID=A0AAE3ZGV3_9ACTN|nr:carbamoyltransferase HypF [Haloactinomyces albus]MDR7303368.1 hydrogenase maturation protein HypF [Haloactinomyces albus]
MDERVRRRARVDGIVQGVGFRPFVHSLATRFGLSGHVGNDVHGVFLEVEGEPAAVECFLDSLTEKSPPLAVIESMAVEELSAQGGDSFEIVVSDAAGTRETLVPADSATCADCLHEMSDPADRRFGYPFINCTNCGPRFTIVRDIPYDRPLTTMAAFAMCARCESEYHDPADRRFHAQPVCCPNCGPRLRLRDADGLPLAGDPLTGVVAALGRGEVAAIKGLGGYHLAVDATHQDATATLRKRKHREDKPFAIMVADVDRARSLCVVDETEQALLTSPRRPIVLLRTRPDTALAAAVAPGNHELGVMLPYTPLHQLLLRRFGAPIVLTSGNVSDEPIAYSDDDALARLSGIADVFLSHDRAIHLRTDDSVVRAFRGRERLVRRSRGYVPQPVTLAWDFPRQVLACGAELKNTFCVTKQHHAVVSHHIGDLENHETLTAFTDGIEHFRRLFEVDPRIVAHDLHPEYLSTKYALDRDGVELVGVQHHHAHIAACLADSAESGPVIGVAFDGLGYGTDGTLWGGEFLLADLVDFRRLAHLEPVPMPGASTAIRQPWRMAVAHLLSAYGQHPQEDLDLLRRNEQQWPTVAEMATRGINAPLTSSAGRLFDAAAAILGMRNTVTFEGQAAIELEQAADRDEPASYPVAVTGGAEPLRVQGADLIRAVTEDLRAGATPAVISARFHNGVADMISEVCTSLREATGVSTVALSGGVFQNVLLLERATARLEARGFRVLLHARVPANDGGISLGQAVIAGARDRIAR